MSGPGEAILLFRETFYSDQPDFYLLSAFVTKLMLLNFTVSFRASALRTSKLPFCMLMAALQCLHWTTQLILAKPLMTSMKMEAHWPRREKLPSKK